MTCAYRVYGLVVQVPFPCPALVVAPSDVPPDVTVRHGLVPRRLAAPAAEGPSWQAEPGRFLWEGGRHAGRFLAEDGRVVTVESGPAASDDLLARHLVDAVLAALLCQRHLLVLHANAALTPSGAVAVSGASGAGKSTTLAALMARGCRMLSDDITVVGPGPRGDLEVQPGAPVLHLTEDAAAGLGTSITGLPRFPWRRMKAAVPAHADMAAGAAPLRALYLLCTHPSPEVQVRPLAGAQKFAAVIDCMYGPLLPEQARRQFPLFAAFSERIPVYLLQRPVSRWTADEVAGAILDTGRRPVEIC